MYFIQELVWKVAHFVTSFYIASKIRVPSFIKGRIVVLFICFFTLSLHVGLSKKIQEFFC